jgi:hypothetical protein
MLLLMFDVVVADVVADVCLLLLLMLLLMFDVVVADVVADVCCCC